MPEKWISATVKLTCACTFDVPVEHYHEWWPGKDANCSTHGEQVVARVSRLGTK